MPAGAIRVAFFSFLALASNARAQVSSAARFDEGLPFYSQYSLDHLGEGAVSVLLTEDGLGRMVAIDNGVLMVFDGNAWSSRLKLGTTGADSIIVARMGLDGRYYAGTVGMWGQLHCDEDGDFVFRYNQSEAPDWTSAAHFDEIAVTSKGVFFYSTLGTVFQEYWTGKCKYWNDKVPIDLIFEHKERVYMSLGSGGVFSLEGDEWVVVPGTEHMTSSDAIMRMEPLDEGRALLVSHSGRLYAFDGQVLEPFASDSEELLAKGVVDMERLLSGDYAFAIRGYGILVLDKNGHQIMRLGVDHDETFASISDLYQQENGILWASMPSGISKVYYPSQVSFFDYRFDIPVQWPEVYHFRDKLMIYSDYRIFLSNYDAVGQISSFEEVKIQGVDLIESCIGYGDEIIFGSGGSIFTYDMKSPPRLIMEGISSARICELNEYEGYLMVFGNDKHALLHRVNGNWVVVQTLSSMGFPAVVLQTNDGEMWVEHGLGRVCRIWSENGRMEYQNFERIEGMDNAWLNVWEYRGQVYLCTGPVIRRFERETGRIVPAPEMDGFIKTLGATVSRVFEGPDGTVWASGQQGVTLLRTIDGKTVVDRETLRPVSEAHSLVRFDGDQIVWLLSRNRVVRFNAAQGHPQYNELFPRLGHAANLISSSGEREIITLGDDERTRTILPYEKNNITLRLFPNTYSLPSPPMYRYRLSGVNSSWSSPFKEPILSFTNLREGDYRLDIEMLYQGLSVGAVSSFHFEIEPPWMRTWWAYVSYFFSSVALILIIVRISQRHNERERRRLEGLVNSRTKELDQTNSRLRESIKSAMAAAEAKSRFLANMSHEIRTPMNGVVGTTELLIRTPLSDEQKELVDIINKSGNLLLGIVNDVLDYSKIEADQLVFELIPLRPQSLVDDVLEILSERANEKHVEFFGSVAPECPVEFIGDSTRLQQVLVNLASNALKFTEHGEVEIRGWSEKREDGRWELHFSVRDTGIGMDPKRMNRLFKAFSQLDASNTRVYGGTGLGLAISKRLIERMGGDLSADSEVGKGSIFHMHIPLPLSERELKREPLAGNGARVLIVDDCKARREAVLLNLQSVGFKVKGSSCADALSHIQKEDSFDAVVVDCSSENDDWTKVAEAVGKSSSSLPLIAYRRPLQNVDHPAVLRRLAKPWRCSRLASEIRGCLDMHLGLTRGITSVASSDDGIESMESMNLRVLLAEDNQVNQRVGVLLLGKLGIKPDLAVNGQETVDLVCRQEYDIVLMDVQMPVMDGIQATKAIRNTLPADEQPIIVALTAGAMSSDRESAFSAGVDAYLTKPLRLETLREQLRDLSEKVMMRRAARKGC